ncbi:MAG TPA: hypothetical protein VN495_03585 [Candidatus Paceibacterota bacterium]|nr:hypothetical protein [Candidatus Paceibacterota bacterium]
MNGQEVLCSQPASQQSAAAGNTNAPPTFTPLQPAPGGTALNKIYTSNGLSGYINTVFTFAISLGAIAAVLRLVYAGYIYMVSDLWTSKGKAKEIIGNVVFGLLLLLSIYLILKQINPGLLNLSFLSDFNSGYGDCTSNAYGC